MAKMYSFKQYVIEQGFIEPKDYPKISCAEDSKTKLRELWKAYGEDYKIHAMGEERDYEDYGHLWDD